MLLDEKQVLDLIIKSVNGKLSVAETEVFNIWLQNDADNPRLVEELREWFKDDDAEHSKYWDTPIKHSESSNLEHNVVESLQLHSTKPKFKSIKNMRVNYLDALLRKAKKFFRAIKNLNKRNSQ
jgi:hypothetical protein